MPRSLDPGSPSGSHQCDPCVLASGTLKPLPTAFLLLTGLNRLREVRLPCGLQCSLCTLHDCCSPKPWLRESRNTRYGLLVKLCPIGTSHPKGGAPYKKRQAALGALTTQLSSGGQGRCREALSPMSRRLLKRLVRRFFLYYSSTARN